jgi:hypothetical protein
MLLQGRAAKYVTLKFILLLFWQTFCPSNIICDCIFYQLVQHKLKLSEHFP